MDIREVTMKALTGGQSSVVSISGASAQSAAFAQPAVPAPQTGDLDATITPTVDCFVRQGTNPTALADGTDQILLGGNTYRLSGILVGNKLAFITSGAAGSVYITPGA